MALIISSFYIAAEYLFLKIVKELVCGDHIHLKFSFVLMHSTVAVQVSNKAKSARSQTSRSEL